MKNFLIFLAGFVLGVVSIIVVGAAVSSSSKDSVERMPGLTFFEQPGECLSTRSFEVLQALDQGAALAQEIKSVSRFGNITSDLLVLLVNEEGAYYYDNQVVDVPHGKCMRQVGIYRYTTKSDMEKTVPVVKLMDL